MAENEEKILFFCTHGDDDPEKAAIPFVMANAALAMDVKAMIVLQAHGAYLAKKGYAENMVAPGGFEAMKKLITDFLELGGELRICVPCMKARHMEESDLIEGAESTAAGALDIEAIKADAVFVY